MDEAVSHIADEIDRQPPARFSKGARHFTEWTGSPVAACVVVSVAAAWLGTGPLSGYSRGWELVASAGVPFVSLLMLVIIQHTQNHNNKALQLKLDELIRASARATNKMMTVEDRSGHDLDEIQRDFQSQAE